MTAPAPAFPVGTRVLQRRTGRVGEVTRLRLDDAGQVQSVELTCLDGSKVITSPCQLRPFAPPARPVNEEPQPTLFDQLTP